MLKDLLVVLLVLLALLSLISTFGGSIHVELKPQAREKYTREKYTRETYAQNHEKVKPRYADVDTYSDIRNEEPKDIGLEEPIVNVTEPFEFGSVADQVEQTLKYNDNAFIEQEAYEVTQEQVLGFEDDSVFAAPFADV